jgi:KEOPS complex subunit Cgi121
VRIIKPGNQHSHTSVNSMPSRHSLSKIRTAYCTINDRAVFLRNLQVVAGDYNTHIICFNADMIAGKVHADTAMAQAVRAFEEGTNISNTLEMEALLYAAGSRQCNIASSFGIHEGENRIWIGCSPDRDEVWTALAPFFRYTQEDWDAIDAEKKVCLMKIFSISPEEIEAAGGDGRLIDLVLERVALLQVLR